jgi:hypothetical protein
MLVNDLKMYCIGCDSTQLNGKREKLDKLLYKESRETGNIENQSGNQE